MYFAGFGNLEEGDVAGFYAIVQSKEISPVCAVFIAGFFSPESPDESLACGPYVFQVFRREDPSLHD